MNESLKPIEPEYVYVTIPAEYICVYHRILVMLADFGEEMLKDCKASCTDRNSNVIQCFNLFNAAVAARKLGKDKLAETIIKYVKAKINQIYKNTDNSPSFVFPIDENGQIKAFVSCGERPHFYINPNDGELYEHKFNNGFDEHFHLGPEDESSEDEQDVILDRGLSVIFVPQYHLVDGEYRPCGDLNIYYDGIEINPEDAIVEYYFDGREVLRWNDIANLSEGIHNFTVSVTYNEQTKIVSKDLEYENS